MTGHQWDPTCRPSHRLDSRIQDFNGPGKQGHRAALESPAWISALELPRYIHAPVATQDSRRRNHNNDLEHAGTMNNEGSEIKFKLMKNFKKLDGGMSKGCRSWWLAKQEVPKDVHIITPRTYEYVTLCSKRDVAGARQLKILR